MPERSTPAAFYRGGTSKAVFFRTEDLPAEPAERDRLLLHVLGSPDPYGRQLNGLGGGISSLSKAMWVERSRRKDADVDYTFAQVSVDKPEVDYSANCGNMTSAVGPFAVDQGIFPVDDGEATVRLYNINTDVVVHARFAVAAGRAVSEGDLEIPGVAGTGAPIRLAFQAPLGGLAASALPTGNARDVLDVEGVGEVEATIAAAAALCVFVKADDFGVGGAEPPAVLDDDRDLMEKLDAVRRTAAVAAGLCGRPEDAPEGSPKAALIAGPGPFTALDGRQFRAAESDIAVRMESMGNIHRAVPLTGAMCLAAAARMSESLAAELSTAEADADLRIANPSGVLTMNADVRRTDTGWHVASTTALRTFRRLMDGRVYHP